MVILATKDGGFLYDDKESALASLETIYCPKANNMSGWLFWTDDVLEMLLQIDIPVIMKPSGKEYAAKQFVEAMRKVQAEISA